MSRVAIREQLATLSECYVPPARVDTSALPAPIERTRRAPAALRAQGLASTDLAGKLEMLSGDALDRASDILQLDISNEEDEKFGEKVRGLNAAIKTVLATQVRVDEHRLKQRSLDVLPELLEKIKAHEAQQKTGATP